MHHPSFSAPGKINDFCSGVGYFRSAPTFAFGAHVQELLHEEWCCSFDRWKDLAKAFRNKDETEDSFNRLLEETVAAFARVVDVQVKQHIAWDTSGEEKIDQMLYRA